MSDFDDGKGAAVQRRLEALERRVRRTRTACVLLLMAPLVLFTIGAASPKTHKDLLDLVVTPELRTACGLHKLTEQEHKYLSSTLSQFVGMILKRREVGQSAKAYLENEGWEEVRVIGTRRLKLDEDHEAQEYVIVEAGVWTYILEPYVFANLTPGSYLGQMGFVSCEVIDRDGHVVRFWTEDTR